MSTDTGYLPRLESRARYVDHLEGLATAETKEASGGRPKHSRIKTYMLETARDDHAVPALDSLFSGAVHLHRLDDTLYRVEDASHGRRVVALLESLADGRHPVLYTALPVAESDNWVRRVVDQNPWLDRLWLSSPILFELWKYVQRTTPDHRFVRLGFEHEAWYEIRQSDLNATDEDISDEEPTFRRERGDAAQPDRASAIHGVSHRAACIAQNEAATGHGSVRSSALPG